MNVVAPSPPEANRGWRRWLARGSLMLLGWLALLLAARWATAVPMPEVETPRLALWPRVGVNLAPQALDNASLLQMLHEAGVRWVRVEVPWAEVEPAPGRYRWAPWDARWQRLQRFGLTPVVVLNTSPAWARAAEDRDNPLAPPARPEDLARFAGALARRYGDVLRYYQVWDEPNIAPHWGRREADPLGYVRLLAATATALRRADPDAVLLSAALAPTLDPGRVNYNDLAYLDALYRLGADAWFDVLAWQGYGFDRPPEDPPAPDRLNFRRVELAREVMRRYGDADTPIWITGFGWNALSRPTPWKEVPAPIQRAYLARALAWAERHLPWSGPLFWVHAYPNRPPAAAEWGFALWDPDGTPRPAWQALAALATRVVVPPGAHAFPLPCPLAAPTCRPADTPVVLPLRTPATGERVTLPFRGTGLILEVTAGPHWQTLWVTVDGRPAPDLPRTTDGRAYLNLYRARATRVRVLVAHDLPYGDHTLTLEGGPGDPVWALNALTVLPYPLTPPWPLVVGLLVAGGSALLLALRRPMPAVQVSVPVPPGMAWPLAVVAATVPFAHRLVRVGDAVYVLPEVALLLAWAWWWAGLFRAHVRGQALPSISITLPLGRSLSLGALVLAGLIGGLVTGPWTPAVWVAVRTRVLFPLGLYLLLRVSPPQARYRAVQGLLVGGTVLALWALGDLVMGRAAWEGPVPRVRAFFGSPNHLALVLTRVWPFALLWAWQPRRRLRWVPAVTLFLALVATGSRGAWLLAMPAALLALTWNAAAGRPRWHRGVLPVVVLGLVLTLLRDTASWAQRERIWAGVVRLLQDRPWFGAGLGRFPDAYPHYALPSAWREPLLYHAHNVLLTTAADLGLPAALGFLGLLLRALRRPASGNLARAARASLWAGLAFGLVDAFWALDDLAYLTALVWALLASPVPERQTNLPERPRCV